MPAVEKYLNLSAGGAALASRLAALGRWDDPIVLGIVRGGVPGAVEVAAALDAPCDVLGRRGLLVPHGPQLPVGLVDVGGTLVIDPEVAERASADPPFAALLDSTRAALRRMSVECRGDRMPLDVAGRNVVVVDNGVRTGGTMAAACRAVRALGARGIVAAVPVAAEAGRPVVEPFVDELICLHWPAPFGHVGMWYARFTPPEADEIRRLLQAVDAARNARRLT